MAWRIRAVERRDASAWIELRHALYGDERAVHEGEVEDFFRGAAAEPRAALLAVEGERRIGLVELSIRPWAEGCSTSGVAYLEGWYVRPEARGVGVGRALLEASEDWARQQGCSELASDTALDNEGSLRAHLACGFQEVARLRCFRKGLHPPISSPPAAPASPSREEGRVGIRRLGRGDADLARTVVARFHGRAVGETWLRGLLDAPRNLLLVALLGDEPIGFLWAHWFDRLKAERRQLFVYEIEVAGAHRRRGVGERLMRTALRAAADESAETFVLTHRGNTPAAALFERVGGQIEGGDDLLLVFPPPQGQGGPGPGRPGSTRTGAQKS